MKAATTVNLVLAMLVTLLQYSMFSANALIGIFGFPLLVIWCLVAHADQVRVRVHATVSTTIAFFIAYGPMIATILGVKLWRG